MDLEHLDAELRRAFDGDENARRVVTRQARDLADSGCIEADFGYELTVADVVDHLEDAPDGYDLVDRWNWWLGSLDVTRPGYRQFRVRSDVRRSRDE